MDKRLTQFCTLLKEQKFYEAHEVLEEVWFGKRFEDDNEIKFLKGLINASVSFELKKRGRVGAAKKVWKNYLKYRQLFYGLSSVYKNSYYQTMRFVDML